jgi:hypothetical protein
LFKDENQARINVIAQDIASEENTNRAAAYQLAVKQEWEKEDPEVWEEKARAVNSVAT